MAQPILNELLNGCVGSVERGLIYNHDPSGRKANLFAGFRGSLQELRVNDDSGSLGKPELVGELIKCVCRVRVSSHDIRGSLKESEMSLRRDSAKPMQRPENDSVIYRKDIGRPKMVVWKTHSPTSLGE